jgi:hypothetical protein
VKRACLIAVVTVFSLAQPSRDDYRAAYKEWQLTDPNLEREAVAGGAPIAQRADRMAAQAAKSAAERKKFLEALAKDQEQQVAWLEIAALNPASPDTAATSDARFVVS